MASVKPPLVVCTSSPSPSHVVPLKFTVTPPLWVSPRTSPPRSDRRTPPLLVSNRMLPATPAIETPPFVALRSRSLCRGTLIRKLTDHDSWRPVGEGPVARTLPPP